MNNNKSSESKTIELLKISLTIIFIVLVSKNTYAVTLIDYNKYINEGRLYNLGDFDARYNPNVLKYSKL